MKNIILTFSLVSLFFVSTALYCLVSGRIELQAQSGYTPIKPRTMSLN